MINDGNLRGIGMDKDNSYDELMAAIHELSLGWNDPLGDDQVKVFSAILEQHEDNFERFKKLSPHLQECSAINYLNLDSFTHFFLYLSAVEATGGVKMPGISMGGEKEPQEFYAAMSFSTGMGKGSQEFISVLRWFDYFLGRSSTLVLYTLRSKYGEEVIVEMTTKLSEYKIDPRIIDFVSLVVDWESKDLNSNFSQWVKEVYRWRSLPDEGMRMMPFYMSMMPF